jgi:DNA-binding NarL/FixJ family response regulator
VVHLLEQLSGGEHTVSPYKAEGRSNAAIAAQMYVALKTVEGWGYAASVFTKLGLPPPAGDNRRVLPVLTWLRTGPIRHADV